LQQETTLHNEMGTRGGPTPAPVCVCLASRVHQVPIFTYSVFVVPWRAILFTLLGVPVEIYIAFFVFLPHVIYARRGHFGIIITPSSVLTHTGTPVIYAHASRVRVMQTMTLLLLTLMTTVFLQSMCLSFSLRYQ
jgi:hypothetical protein